MNGTAKVLYPAGDTEMLAEEPNLEELQKRVDGYIERVRVIVDGKEADMIVNEEGHLKRLTYNRTATKLYWDSHKYASGPIVGVAIVLTGSWRLK